MYPFFWLLLFIFVITNNHAIRRYNDNDDNDINYRVDIDQFRKKYQPENINFDNDEGIQQEYKKGFVFLYKQDKQDHPVIYFNVSNYDKDKRDLDAVKRLTIYMLDTAMLRSSNNKFIVIVDCYNFSITKTLDFDMMNMVLNMIQSSSMLEKVIVIRVSLLFKTIWNMIKVLLNNNTRLKVMFLDTNELTNFIDTDNLPIGFRFYNTEL